MSSSPAPTTQELGNRYLTSDTSNTGTMTQSMEMSPWRKQLMGFSPGSDPYSPYQAMSRHAKTMARMYEGLTTKPNEAQMRKFYGLKAGEDLAPHLRATRSGMSQPKYAGGGLMALRKFADGGDSTATSITTEKKASPTSVKDITTQRSKDIKAEQEANAAIRKQLAEDIKTWNEYQKQVKKGTVDTTKFPTPPMSPADLRAKANEDIAQNKEDIKQIRTTAKTDIQDFKVNGPNTVLGIPAADMFYSVPNYDPYSETAGAGTIYGGITNLMGQEAIDRLVEAGKPSEEVTAGAGIVQDAAEQLLEQGGYTPQMIDAAALQGAAAQMGTYEKVEAQKADVERAMAAAINRGDVREAAALKADVDKYNAALMQAPKDIQASTYDAATTAGNVAKMAAPTGISAQDYVAAQSAASQMAGPKSWTDAGTAEQYMSPYMQNVVDIQKREANRDYQRQLNELNKQAVAAKAYGGSRLAIERAEAARNQQQKLADIEATGLQQAYQQGIGQFTTEQAQGLQAGQANLSAAQQTALANQQATNQQRSQYVTQALEAAKSNYGGQLTAEQQNMIAQNAATQYDATAQNQQRSQYVTQALQAAQANYGGQLTAAQQNQVAQNAAAQFNSAAQNAANTAYSAQDLQAQLANQGIDWNTVQQNAANQQQTNLANAAAQNTANQNYAAQQLQAALANQQAGLTTAQQNAALQQQMALANQQTGLTAATQNQQAGLTGQGLNLQSLNQAGNLGQGLGNLGLSTRTQDMNLAQLYGNAYGIQQGLANNAADASRLNAAMVWGGVPSVYGNVANMILSAPGTTGSSTTNTSGSTTGYDINQGNTTTMWGSPAQTSTNTNLTALTNK